MAYPKGVKKADLPAWKAEQAAKDQAIAAANNERLAQSLMSEPDPATNVKYVPVGDPAKVEPNTFKAGQAPKEQVSIGLPQEPDPSAPPPNLFNGFVKKLDVFGKPGTDPKDPIPGYQLYWFNDEGFTISQARASGWMHVQKEEVALNDAHDGPGNNDLGGNVRRMVSRPENPVVVHAYLMKKPNWLHELHLTGPDSIEQKVHQKTEAQLLGGTAGENRPEDRRYSAGSVPAGRGASNLPPISISFKTN